MGKISALLALVLGLASPLALAQNQGGPNRNLFGQQQVAPIATGDAAVGRGYFQVDALSIPGGAKLKVDIYHMVANASVSLYLQVALNDGVTGRIQVIDLKQLDNAVADNPANFRSHREFDVSYAELNQTLHTFSPALAGVQIGPGTPLFLFARWVSGHQWGGVGRGGIFFLPSDSQASIADTSTTPSQVRTDSLDLAYSIPQVLGNLYNDPATQSGIKVGGQIRSRMEAEGKFQVADADLEKVRQEIYRLSQNPAEALKVLGSDWTLTLNDRYMKRDAQGQLVKDAVGLPTPDPMVDTYYDNATFDAAKHDIAIRYRWTEGNQAGAWNFKPGLGNVTSEGLVYRLEYGVDTTDDKPQTVQKFADSLHPLNPFRFLSQSIPGAKPSDFLLPAVKISDVRYKYLLKHKDGLAIEVSLDNVTASDLRGGSASAGYAQLEMDVEHLAVQGANVSGPGQSLGDTGNIAPAQAQSFLTGLTNAAYIDGRPVIHENRDLLAGSPLFSKHQAEFDLAAGVIQGLRKHLLGDHWMPGAQKYALAAVRLGLVTEHEASPSVKTLKGRMMSVDCGKLFGGDGLPTTNLGGGKP